MDHGLGVDEALDVLGVRGDAAEGEPVVGTAGVAMVRRAAAWTPLASSGRRASSHRRFQGTVLASQDIAGERPIWGVRVSGRVSWAAAHVESRLEVE